MKKNNYYRVWHKEDKAWINLSSAGYTFNPNNGQIYIHGMNITDRLVMLQATGVHDDKEEDTDVEIFDQDILEMEYDGRTFICKVQYEAGGYLLVSNEFEDGYVMFSDIVDNDGSYFWLPKSKVLGSYVEKPELYSDY